MSAAAPCVGFSPFHVATMLSICESCPAEVKAACLQSAADAPFPFLEPQVWGGVVLPRDRDLLPASAVRAVRILVGLGVRRRLRCRVLTLILVRLGAILP